MSGTGASNLGYGRIIPLSNVNGNYVNVTASNNPANFGSNQIPGLPGLSGAKNNVDAAMGKVPGICVFKGGSRLLKRKIKNISKKYRMNKKSRKSRSIKNRIRKSFKLRRVRGKGKRKSFSQRGGYSQYQNNLPMTPTYSVGGILKPGNSALAEPPPIKVLSNCVNCVDNYNHYTGKGFPSKNH